MRGQPAVIRVFDDPEPSIATGSSDGGAKIYCQEGGFVFSEESGMYEAVTPFTLTVSDRVTIATFLNVTYAVTPVADDGYIQLSSWVIAPPPPGAGTQFDGPMARRTQMTPFGASATFPLTDMLHSDMVFTTDAGDITFSPFFQMGGTPTPTYEYANYYLVVIVGDNTEDDCRSYSSPL